MKDLNFFSSYNKKKEKLLTKDNILYSFLFLVMLAVITYGSMNFYNIKRLNRDISMLQNQILTIKSDSKINEILDKEDQIIKYRDSISKLKKMDEYINKKNVINEDLLMGLEDNLPPKVFLKSIIFNTDSIKLEGKSKDKDSIAQFQYNLNSIKSFGEIFIPHITDEIDSFGFVMDIKYKEENLNGAETGKLQEK